MSKIDSPGAGVLASRSLRYSTGLVLAEGRRPSKAVKALNDGDLSAKPDSPPSTKSRSTTPSRAALAWRSTRFKLDPNTAYQSVTVNDPNMG